MPTFKANTNRPPVVPCTNCGRDVQWDGKMKLQWCNTVCAMEYCATLPNQHYDVVHDPRNWYPHVATSSKPDGISVYRIIFLCEPYLPDTETTTPTEEHRSPWPTEEEIQEGIALCNLRAEEFATSLGWKPRSRSKSVLSIAEWTTTVKSASKWKCYHCGSDHKLKAHHILPRRWYPQVEVIVENGVCLCTKCHAKAHTRATDKKDKLHKWLVKESARLIEKYGPELVYGGWMQKAPYPHQGGTE